MTHFGIIIRHIHDLAVGCVTSHCPGASESSWQQSHRLCSIICVDQPVCALLQLPPCQPLPDGMLATWPGDDPPSYQHPDQFRQQQQLEAMGQVIGLNSSDTSSGGDAGSSRGSPSGDNSHPGKSAPGQQGGANQPAGSSRTLSRSASRSLKRHRTAVGTYRIPSFNWLVAFLVECRRQIDVMKPVELSTLLWAMSRLNHAPGDAVMPCRLQTSHGAWCCCRQSTADKAMQGSAMTDGVLCRWCRKCHGDLGGQPSRM